MRCAGLQPRSTALHRLASVPQRTWLVWPLDAHDAVEQLALEGVGKLGVRGAAEELRVELERVVLRARLLVRPRRVVRDRRKGAGARGQAQGGRRKGAGARKQAQGWAQGQ